MRMVLIEPRQQAVWGWPAILNFTLAGAGAGFFLLTAGVGAASGAFRAAMSERHLVLIAPALMVAGVAALSREVGRPLRVRLLFSNLRRSWMSREALATALFLIFSLTVLAAPDAAVVPAGAAAMCVVLSQGFMLRHARGVPAWNSSLMPLLFLSSALATGGGVVLIVAAITALPLAAPALATVAACVVCDILLWAAYLYWPASPDVRAATTSLRRAPAIVAHFGLCGIGPVLLLMAIPAPSTLDAAPRAIVDMSIAACGCAFVARGLMVKRDLLRGAGRLRAVGVQLQAARPGKPRTAATASAGRKLTWVNRP